MFHTKKHKIEDYLAGLNAETMSAFDLLLNDYINGVMKDKMKSEGLALLQIHIDWLDHYKCIEIEGELKQYVLDVQIEPKEYVVMMGTDEDELEDHERSFPLVGREDFYETLHGTIEKRFMEDR